jgi:hypothetical protein
MVCVRSLVESSGRINSISMFISCAIIAKSDSGISAGRFYQFVTMSRSGQGDHGRPLYLYFYSGLFLRALKVFLRFVFNYFTDSTNGVFL